MKGDRHTMKSLILTTQDARELDKLGGLTITKPIKPAPRYIEGASFSCEADCADIWHLVGQDGNRLGAGDGVADVFASPVEVSDVVFIREPWYRLKNPQGGESERVILAADSVVQPEQAAYKWASPVSMPQDAARRFARVKSIEPAYGENVTPAWLIELVAITKEEATAEDGAPLSTSDVPEEASSYYAYVGDMSAEDRDRMVAKIDADRAVWPRCKIASFGLISAAAISLPSCLRSGTRSIPNDRAPLDAENTALDEEQGDLAPRGGPISAPPLEDAKAPAPTVEEHAREKYTNISALLSGPSDAIPTLGDYDAIKAEEQELARYLEQYDKADAAEPDPAPTEEDEEIGSFRLGKCKYCGREWGVTLEGAVRAVSRPSEPQTPPLPAFAIVRRPSPTGPQLSASLWPSQRALVGIAVKSRKSGPTRPRPPQTTRRRRFATARLHGKNVAYMNRWRTLASVCNVFSATTPRASVLSRSPTRRSASSRTWSK